MTRLHDIQCRVHFCNVVAFSFLGIFCFLRVNHFLVFFTCKIDYRYIILCNSSIISSSPVFSRLFWPQLIIRNIFYNKVWLAHTYRIHEAKIFTNFHWYLLIVSTQFCYFTFLNADWDSQNWYQASLTGLDLPFGELCTSPAQTWSSHPTPTPTWPSAPLPCIWIALIWIFFSAPLLGWLTDEPHVFFFIGSLLSVSHFQFISL